MLHPNELDMRQGMWFLEDETKCIEIDGRCGISSPFSFSITATFDWNDNEAQTREIESNIAQISIVSDFIVLHVDPQYFVYALADAEGAFESTGGNVVSSLICSDRGIKSYGQVTDVVLNLPTKFSKGLIWLTIVYWDDDKGPVISVVTLTRPSSNDNTGFETN
eukprot:UN32023